MKNLLSGSWKTTSAGILMILGAGVHIYFNRSDIDEKMVMEGLFALVSGVGLLMCRDNNKTSEDVKAK